MFRAMQVSDTNYYINASTGSNSNNGLSPSSAWQTLQHGANFVQTNIDLGGYQAIFNCTGAFTAGVSLSGPQVGQTSTAAVSFVFASGSSITDPANNCFSIGSNAAIAISGPVTLSALSTGVVEPTGFGISCFQGGTCILEGGVIFGQCGSPHLGTATGGIIVITANYTIAAGAPCHYNVFGFSNIIALPPSPTTMTITLTGTPIFTNAFALARDGGFLQMQASFISFSGAASGTRYSAILNGIIDTNGGGATFFPGSSGGSTATGGQYA